MFHDELIGNSETPYQRPLLLEKRESSHGNTGLVVLSLEVTLWRKKYIIYYYIVRVSEIVHVQMDFKRISLFTARLYDCFKLNKSFYWILSFLDFVLNKK